MGVTCCSDGVGVFHRACVSVINCNKLLQSRNVEQISRVFAACMFKPKCTSSCAAMKCSTCTSFFSSFRGGYLGLFCLVHSIDRALSPPLFFPPPSLPCHPSSLHSLNLSFEVICEAPLLSLRSSLPTLKVSQEFLQSWTLLKSFTCVLLTL